MGIPFSIKTAQLGYDCPIFFRHGRPPPYTSPSGRIKRDKSAGGNEALKKIRQKSYQSSILRGTDLKMSRYGNLLWMEVWMGFHHGYQRIRESYSCWRDDWYTPTRLNLLTTASETQNFSVWLESINHQSMYHNVGQFVLFHTSTIHISIIITTQNVMYSIQSSFFAGFNWKYVYKMI